MRLADWIWGNLVDFFEEDLVFFVFFSLGWVLTEEVVNLGSVEVDVGLAAVVLSVFSEFHI